MNIRLSETWIVLTKCLIILKVQSTKLNFQPSQLSGITTTSHIFLNPLVL